MEYMIQENTLVEIADAVRNKLKYKDLVSSLISVKNKIISVTIPNSVTIIGDWAFYNCTNLESITIPNSVESIGDTAFYNCTSLENVTIPDSVTSIGQFAFYDCTSLSSVAIGNSVECIGCCAFYNCISIESIIIPDSVTDIALQAFERCDNLTDMYLYPTTPPTLDNTNAISSATKKIYVPVGSGDAYKTATNWSAYADIIVEKDIVIE